MRILSIDPGASKTGVVLYQSQPEKIILTKLFNSNKAKDSNRYFFLRNLINNLANNLDYDYSIVECPKMFPNERHGGKRIKSLPVNQRFSGACMAALRNAVEFVPPCGVNKVLKKANVLYLFDDKDLAQDIYDAAYNAKHFSISLAKKSR